MIGPWTIIPHRDAGAKSLLAERDTLDGDGAAPAIFILIFRRVAGLPSNEWGRP
jgi:hypothetical protein